MHKVAHAIEGAVGIPLFRIADPAAEEIVRGGLTTVGLLGTRFTMQQDFYKGRLRERHGIDAVIPDKADRAVVHRVIYEELCLGKIFDDSRAEYRRINQGRIGISFPSAPHDASVCGRIRLPSGGLVPQSVMRAAARERCKGRYGKYCAPSARFGKFRESVDSERRLVRAQAMSGTAS